MDAFSSKYQDLFIFLHIFYFLIYFTFVLKEHLNFLITRICIKFFKILILFDIAYPLFKIKFLNYNDTQKLK
jgi:hypothetical protein